MADSVVFGIAVGLARLRTGLLENIDRLRRDPFSPAAGLARLRLEPSLARQIDAALDHGLLAGLTRAVADSRSLACTYTSAWPPASSGARRTSPCRP